MEGEFGNEMITSDYILQFLLILSTNGNKMPSSPEEKSIAMS